MMLLKGPSLRLGALIISNDASQGALLETAVHPNI